MSRVLTFYFDGSTVQAVEARISSTALELDDARTFPFDELPDYLAGCRSTSCIICCNPRDIYQDIVHLPPAATRHYDTLIRNEISTLHPELTSYGMHYHAVGETIIETKPFSRIAVFCYADDFLNDFIAALNRFNIAITRVYAAPLVLSRLALADCPDQETPRLFIASLPREKQLLVCENGGLEFVRKLPSLDNTLLLEDTGNINMTLDYCYQVLRVHPAEAVMINEFNPAAEMAGFISIPFRASLPLVLDTFPDTIVKDYLAPLAAILHYDDSPRSGTILPTDYVAYRRQKSTLAAAAAIMVVMTALCGVMLVKEQFIINDLKSGIARIRSELSGAAAELANFRKVDDEITALKQPIEFVNKHNSSLNPASALAALQIPTSPDYLVKSVAVHKGDTALAVQIDGIINAAGFSDTQLTYEKLLAAIGRLPGYTGVSGKIDVKQKGFSIQASYNGKGATAR